MLKISYTIFRILKHIVYKAQIHSLQSPTTLITIPTENLPSNWSLFEKKLVCLHQNKNKEYEQEIFNRIIVVADGHASGSKPD